MSVSSRVRVSERYEVTPDAIKMRASAYALVEQLLAMTELEPVHHREVLSIAMWKVTDAAAVAPASFATRLRILRRHCAVCQRGGVGVLSVPARVALRGFDPLG